MSVYSDLFVDIQKTIYADYGSKYRDDPDRTTTHQDDKAKVHSYLYLILEIVIHEHRKKYATIYEQLVGIKALKHKLFTKNKIAIDRLDALSLEEIVFALLEDLNPENLPVAARNYLNKIRLPQYFESIDWNRKINWTLGSGKDYLKNAD